MSIVFSTYVEVIPKGANRKGANNGILHVRGGDPFICFSIAIYKQYSPRMWR